MPKIVVIEDQEEVRENLMETLELADYEVFGACDGHEGVRAVKEHLPQLVLCDVMMPRLDGFGVLELLRKDATTAAIPLVFLTARAERDDLRRGMNLGAADYVTKPFFQDELLRVVELRLADAAASSPRQQAARNGGGLVDESAATAALLALRERGRRRGYHERAPICFAGDTAHSAFYVERGRVRLFRDTDFGKGITVDAVGPGGWVGVGDVIAEAAMSASASAYPEAEVVIVDRAEVVDAFRHEPALGMWLARQLAQDIALRNESLLQVAYFSVRKRVAEFLLRADERLGDGAAERVLDFRREDIAETIGTTPESVTRVLTEFRREGAVELPGAGGVVVASRAKLSGVPA